MFQRYSTLKVVSNGRAEVILGRGSSIDSFPLFGYDLADYEQLFEEKTNPFAELFKDGPVTWQGETRAPLANQDVVPHTEAGPFPVWIGVGGSPESVIRAARYGFSLMLAIIGGNPGRFAAFARLFRQALEQFGQPARPVGVHAPGHVAATDEQAVEEFWPRWRETIRRVAAERGSTSWIAGALPRRRAHQHRALWEGSHPTRLGLLDRELEQSTISISFRGRGRPCGRCDNPRCTGSG